MLRTVLSRPFYVVTPDGTAAAAAAQEDARQAVRLAALARQWRLGRDGQKAGYLLGNRGSIEEASRYAGRDPDIAALVAASWVALHRTEGRRQVVVRAFVGTVVLALGSLALLQWFSVAAERSAGHRANAVWTQDREQTRQEAQAAVDAVRRGDLGPLRDLVNRLAGGGHAELAQLRLAPAAPRDQVPDLTPVAPRAVRANSIQAAAGGAGCAGFLWLGNKGADSRLDDHRDPASLKSGATVTLDTRSGIFLREAWPPDGAEGQSKRTGVVPQGAVVTLLSAPRAFPARNNDVWAQVQVPRAYCSTVFLQFVGPPGKREAVMAAVRALDVQVPPAERVPSAAGLAEVRYLDCG